MSDLNRQRKKISQDKTELYRHFDAAGRLLYVGISVNSPSRLCAHRREAGWADQIVTITIERFPTRREALDAEIRAIQTEKPLHNQAGRTSGCRVKPSAFTPPMDDEPQVPELVRLLRENYWRARARV